MRKIKVLYIITRLVHGGAQDIALLTCANLDGKRYEKKFVAGPQTGTEGDLFEKARQMGIEPVIIPELVREVDLIKDLIAIFKLYCLIAREKFDIVHTFTSKAGFVGRVAAWMARVPVIVQSHQGHIFQSEGQIPGVSPKQIKLFLWLEKFAALITDRIITLTNLEIEQQVQIGVAKPDKFTAIYNAVDLKRFINVDVPILKKKKELGLSPECPVVGTVARLSSEKGHRYLLEAAAMVCEAFPSVQFLLIGDGILRKDLEKQAIELGISENVVFLGLRKDVPEILPVIDLFVLPSLYEGFGIVLVEAMAAGKPVVATRVGGIPEVVVDGKTGILAPPKEPKRIAEAIITLLQDKAQAQKMGQAGHKRAIEHFGLEAMMNKIHHLYEELLLLKGVKDE